MVLMTMTAKEVIKKLQADGWTVDRVKGSHHVMKKGRQIVVVPNHPGDLKPGTLKSILKQTGLKPTPKGED
jgi:predicted RNA binding protein YcfA (HicA-like mRNA interferase family)